MLSFFAYALQYVRSLGHSFFLQFGLHCATHQIRVILISCVVITSLFYPALSIYSSSQPRSLSVIDAFLTPNRASKFHARDLGNLWDSHDTLRVHEDAVSVARCRMNSALRLERILVQSPLIDDDGALNQRILLFTLELERRLQDVISQKDIPCLKRADGRCLVLSPLVFWNYDEDSLRADNNILDTLSSSSKNVSFVGTPVTPDMVLAGRGSYEHHVSNSQFDYATFLAVTFFFPESDCFNDDEHDAWLRTVESILPSNAELAVEVQDPTVIALEYDPSLSKTNGWSALSAFLYMAYIGFIIYVVWSVRRMDAIHSRLGVTFTALVEIAVSTVTSLSVCALVGFKVTMVPWELLPIVIVFVGAENMFNLVDAVGKTSVTLPVKQRIAQGLSKAGTSNTLKVVSYNAILGILAVFTVGAVRQFCVFAIVVLVAHWFLAHTFFMAVLSIDIARLELEELLRHDTSSVNVIPENDPVPSKESRSGWRKLLLTVQKLLKGRAATNLSLLMLLAIAATLYYSTYTTSTTLDAPNFKPLRAVALSKTHASETNFEQSPALRVWSTFNPTKKPLLHIRMDPPTIITFSQSDNSANPMRDIKNPRSSMRTIRLMLWLLKIMVLPIAATTSALWGLLLYLLRNTELLEAQRNRSESSSETREQEGKALHGQVEFSTLPRTFSSDVELLAANQDGRVVISVGLRNEITIWRANDRSHLSIDASDIVLSEASTSYALPTVTCVAVDKVGEFFAIGTGKGTIAIWKVEGDSIRPLPLLSMQNSSAAVTEIHFVFSASMRTPPSSESGPTADSVVTILVTYESGKVARWEIGENIDLEIVTPPRGTSILWSALLHVVPWERVLIAFSMDDGTLELMSPGDYDVTVLPACCLRAGTLSDVVRKVHVCRTELNGSMRIVVATATESGSVSLWDAITGECISVLEEVYGKISQLRVTPVRSETCQLCGQLPAESLAIAFSVDHVIRVYQLFVNNPAHSRRCSCAQRQLRHIPSRESLGRRSRSNSNASLPSSPLLPRARLATAFETSSFPVSGHGVHSRRVSEKDTGRRSTETLTVPFPSDDLDTGHQDGATTTFWRNSVALRLTDITCERGGWEALNGKFIGIRRKPRAQIKTKGRAVKLTPSDGLTAATLERWELWTFDPSAGLMHSSLLDTLTLKPPESVTLSDRVARLPFTRVSPITISSSDALAGFGNTIGIFRFSVI